MQYVKVRWSHDFPDEPVTYLSELGEDRYETRKVQIYRDGRMEWSDENHETATAGLSEIAFPPLEEISSQPEFTAEPITPQEFNTAWAKATSNTSQTN